MVISIDLVYLELTRRCNMQCPHCMRGPAQNIDLSEEDIDTFFDKFRNIVIQRLTLGGGEPTLKPDLIVYVIDKIINEKIMVGKLEMITNGQIFNEKVADAFNRFDEYNKQIFRDNNTNYISERVIIGFSDDKFHKDIPIETIKSYKEHCKWIRFYKMHLQDNMVKKTGLANFGYDYNYELFKLLYEIKDNIIFIGGNYLYLNAKGLVAIDGEASYDDVDKINYGHISNFSLLNFLIDNCKSYNSSNIVENDVVKTLISLKNILYDMGINEETIYKTTGLIVNRNNNVPVYQKILKNHNIVKSNY